MASSYELVVNDISHFENKWIKKYLRYSHTELKKCFEAKETETTETISDTFIITTQIYQNTYLESLTETGMHTRFSSKLTLKRFQNKTKLPESF